MYLQVSQNSRIPNSERDKEEDISTLILFNT
jgi:hypothetical protein